MENHPIESLMNTTMNNLKEMIDVNTIVGESIETINGTIIIPISKVTFGFATGGSEFNGETMDEYLKEGMDEEISYRLPFGGGSGSIVNISPVGFVIVSGTDDTKCPKFIPIDHCNAIDKLLDYVPNILDKMSDMLKDKTTYSYKFYKDGECQCGVSNSKKDDIKKDTENKSE